MVSADSDTSLTLLRQLVAGNGDAWKLADLVYQQLIFKWCCDAGATHQDAEDVAQETMLKVTQRIGEFDHNGNVGAFRKWLRTIAERLLIDRHRKSSGKMPAVGGSDYHVILQNLPDFESESYCYLENTLLESTIAGILGSSSRPQHNEGAGVEDSANRNIRAFIEIHVAGRTGSEVAEELGLKRGSVHKLATRIRTRLQQRLADEEVLKEFLARAFSNTAQLHPE